MSFFNYFFQTRRSLEINGAFLKQRMRRLPDTTFNNICAKDIPGEYFDEPAAI